MATYVPTALIAPTSLVTSSTATTYTPSGSTTGVARTFYAQTATAARTVTLCFYGADAAGLRFLDAYALTVNVPAVYNMWVVIPNAKTTTLYSNGTNTVSGGLFGYEYS